MIPFFLQVLLLNADAVINGSNESVASINDVTNVGGGNRGGIFKIDSADAGDFFLVFAPNGHCDKFAAYNSID